MYSAPGVYIEEISGGAKPIEAVGTSTAGFVGTAPDRKAHVNKAVAINNWTQFVKEFTTSDSTSTELAQAVSGFFANGGRLCYVVNVGDNDSIIGDGRGRKGLEIFEEYDDIAIVAAPGYYDVASHEAVMAHCEKQKDRFGILDPPPIEKVTDLELLKKIATAQATKKSKKSEESEEGPSGDTGTSARCFLSQGSH
jgi:hypothetical protein